MDNRVFDKSKLPSRHVSVGPERAPHRSYYYAMGLTPGQIAQLFVGVASCWNEAAPCNIALMRQASAYQHIVDCSYSQRAKGATSDATLFSGRASEQLLARQHHGVNDVNNAVVGHDVSFDHPGIVDLHSTRVLGNG